jgi:hypothetical protein
MKPMKKTGKKKLPRNATRKKSRTKAKAAAPQKTQRTKAAAVRKKRAQEQGYYEVDTLVGLDKEPRAPAGLQSGDLQGLSNAEVADSQSVDELLEEGNAFEAGVVGGVEDSRKAGTKRVRTRQVPVDDVPREYLDES